MDDKANQIIARHNALLEGMTNWKNLWDDAANYIMPHKGNITSVVSPGEEQTNEVYDSTAEESLLVFAAGLVSQMVPPGELWFRYEPADENSSEPIRAWFDDCTQRAAKAIYSSNFYMAIHEDFLDAGFCGTSNTYLEEGRNNRLNFCNVPIGTYCIAENSEGIVDTVSREWMWTAKQAAEQWGEEKLTKSLREALSSKDASGYGKKFKFIHSVYPRRKKDTKPGQVEGKLRPIESVYVCVEDSMVIEESGFYEMPYAVSRVMRSRNEVWGRGPGTQILPEVRMLNRMEMDLLIATEKHVGPSWLMPDDSAYRPDNRPNGITYWDASNPNNKPERIQEVSRLDYGENKTEQKRKRIRSAFFADMFQMLSSSQEMKREKTAFEVAQMIQEKLVLFSPMFARLVQEKLNPLLERVFAVMLREGMFTPPPEGLEGTDYEISYVSKIALAIKAAQNNSLMELLQIANAMVPFDQSVASVVNWRKAFRDVARNRGTSADWMRTDEEVDQMISDMQKAAAAQQAANTAKTMSETAKNLGPQAQQAASGAMAGAM